mmetsp:Transcript_27126/g.54577  ORF Transcript_27126/g.54577 Transcript_27126/m.54577 type:complete len:176 (-) Transcript_27126:590-1117(-)
MSLLKLHRTLCQRFGTRGFDLVHPFRVSWYNESLTREKLELKPIPTFGRDDCPAFLIGHSKHFWDAFISSVREGPQLLAESDPIDTYSKQTIDLEMEAQNQCGADYKLFLSNEYGDRLVSMQRIADIGALAQLDYNTYLSVHPVFGPWIAFRAVQSLHAQRFCIYRELELCGCRS